MLRFSHDLLLDECRTLASRSAWGELRAAVEQWMTVSPEKPAPVGAALVPLYAEALMREGHPQEARDWLTDRDLTVRLSGDRATIRRVANLLGAACLELGDLEAAVTVFEHALDLARADGDDLLLARATNNLAVIASIRGRLTEALGLYSLVVPAYQRVGNVSGIAESYHNTAIALRKLQRLDQADEHERRAAEFARQVKNRRLVALTLVGRAEISLLRGDAQLAEATATRAASELHAVHDPARQADAIRLCGVARLAAGKTAQALESLDEAVSMAVAHGNRLIEAESRWGRAQVRHALGDRNGTLDDGGTAVALFMQLRAEAEQQSVTTWLTERGYHLP